ncbi:hypothetical protein L3X38_010000 [Prunus dulcis]|uniref:LRAT domain-containing protein n=1 Tax=Prunus dulcis TaxID=3755 RepID=A0AAD4WEL3_PRUDU|nr:hypothetical protein L3X38_010000 [Prunus dulcis]
MRLLSNRTSGEELQPGNHIYSYRKGHTYFHHGIYVGEGWVIHFTATDEPITTSSTEPRCRSCGHDPNTKRGVLKTCVDCFLKGHGLLRFEYNVSLGRFILKQKGTCSTETCYPSDKIVRLATEIFKKDEVDGTGFGEYNLFNNNCENFASYCKTGKRVSARAEPH